jgi:SAM-dependent methyltransferase
MRRHCVTADVLRRGGREYGRIRMDVKHLDELAAIEAEYWWHVAKRELVIELLARHFPPPARIVEGGFGGGAMLAALQARGYDVAGLDALPDAVAYARGRGIADVRRHDLEEPWPSELRSVSAVLFLDVLEHLLRPVDALRWAAGALKDGGGIVVTVPAGPWLRGPWDELLGHQRRYTLPGLQTHAREAGLCVRWASHWNAFSLPAAVVVRLAEKLGTSRRSAEFLRVPRPVNTLLKACGRGERRLMRRWRLPIGLSLAAVLTQWLPPSTGILPLPSSPSLCRCSTSRLYCPSSSRL